MKNKKVLILCLSVLLILLVSSCVPGGGSHSPKNPAGFLWGIWHGWIAPVSLVWGFFESNVRVYGFIIRDGGTTWDFIYLS